MRYVTYGGEIAELTDEDLVEAARRMPGGYNSIGVRRIPVDYGFIDVELFSIPDTDLGGIKARSPVLWRATHQEGFDRINLDRLHGEVANAQLVHFAVRKAVAAQIGSTAANFWSTLRTATIVEILGAIGWPPNRDNIELDLEKNLNYLVWPRLNKPLSAVANTLKTAVVEAKTDLTRQIEETKPRSALDKAKMQPFKLATCDVRPIQNQERITGSASVLNVFNQSVDLQLVIIETTELSSTSTKIYLSTFGSRKPLAFQTLLQVVDDLKKPVD